MVDAVKIEMTEEDVQSKTDSEKLSALVKIAFANHEQLAKQGRILFGNGRPKDGLCFKVETQGTRLNWLIGILSALGIAGITTILTCLFKKV